MNKLNKLIVVALAAMSLSACSQERLPYALTSVQATLEDRCANYGGVSSAYITSTEPSSEVDYTIKYFCQKDHWGTIHLKEAKR